MGRETNFNRKKQHATRNVRKNRQKRLAKDGVKLKVHSNREPSAKRMKRMATRRKILDNLLREKGFSAEDIALIHAGSQPQGARVEDKLAGDDLLKVTEYMRKMAVANGSDMKDDE